MASPIIFERVNYSYDKRRKAKSQALLNVSFKINPGSFTMIVGKTGSGKSTLVQQINGLLRPTGGNVKVGTILVKPNMTHVNVMKLRREVGLVFQVAQDQLFGETVRDDLAFGPRNFGFNPDQIKAKVRNSAKALNLSKQILDKSPFDLSGGQMKRVAIAGVLACQPRILVLDEPTVGLDSFGESRIMQLLLHLKSRYRLTIIMVTHQMDLVAKYATQVLVMQKGKLLANVTPKQLFSNDDLVRQAGLKVPFAPRFAMELSRLGVKLPKLPLDLEQLAQLIVSELRTRRYP